MKKIPEITYKYRSWKAPLHKRIITENELYFSAPSMLNDPNEFKIFENWGSMKTIEDVEEFIRLKIENLQISIKKREIYKKNIRYNFINGIDIQEKSNKYSYSKFDKDLGVLSLCTEWNIELMWENYGDEHKGFCIGFNTNNILDPENIDGNHVDYVHELPKLNPLLSASEKAIKKVYTKLKDWEHEQEFRLLKLNPNGLKEKSERVYKIEDNSIAEIILGANMELEDKKEIIEIAHNRNIKIYEVFKIPFSLELIRKEI